MNIVDLLKKNVVMVPVIASLLVGTFTGVKYIVDLTETINISTGAGAVAGGTIGREIGQESGRESGKEDRREYWETN